MGKVIFEGGDKVKMKDSELPIQGTATAKNLNDLKNANNDNDTRISILEAGGGTESIEASVQWVSGLTFDISANRFPVENVFYTATPGQRTSDAADLTLDRIDLYGAFKPIAPATVGEVGIIKGSPAAAGVVTPPDYDASMFYPIKIVLIKAASTIPSDVDNVLIYDENTGEPNEWVGTADNANIVFNSPEDPNTGTVSIKSTNQVAGNRMIFTTTNFVNTKNIDLITFYLKLGSAFGQEYIWLRFFDEEGTFIGAYSFKDGQNDFVQNNLEYQKISIEGSKLQLNEFNIKSFELYLYAPFTNSHFFVDTIQFHKGSGNDQTTPITLPIIFRGKRMDMGDGLQLDLGIADTFTRNELVNAANDFVLINLPTGFETQTATMYLTGEQPWTLAQGTKLFGEYDGSVLNQIVIEVVNGDTEQIYYSINTLTV